MNIKLLVLDVDGTLTDSTIYYGNDNVEIKAFSTKDGAVLKPLRQIGIDVIFLTGRKSEAVTRRASDVDAIAIQGIENKLAVLHELFIERNIKPEECAYVGDDLNDYAAMKLCGFRGCPRNAAIEIREICHYVSTHDGGCGAVRDVVEYILKKCGHWKDVMQYFEAMPNY